MDLIPYVKTNLGYQIAFYHNHVIKTFLPDNLILS